MDLTVGKDTITLAAPSLALAMDVARFADSRPHTIGAAALAILWRGSHRPTVHPADAGDLLALGDRACEELSARGMVWTDILDAGTAARTWVMARLNEPSRKEVTIAERFLDGPTAGGMSE